MDLRHYDGSFSRFTLLFHDVFGYSSAYSGMVLATMALSIVAVSYYSGFLADKLGTQKITSMGIMLMLIGMMTLLIGVYVKLNWILIMGNLILGAGVGIFNPANNKMIMQSVPNEFAAMAASINVLSRNAGIAIGIALSGIGYSALISFHLPPDMAAASVLGLFLILNIFVRKIKVQ
ncbi:MFS transporter [Desulfosporosinus sp. BICA1-9]|uniref:MFS transporter n=1 Tax=Desulfosporosinus sp. BICA1-9 TaxID=1531958 RepID=UPI0025BDC10B|nr:MFS transporter [Desulfosporosinus sp. BICA1-9]